MKKYIPHLISILILLILSVIFFYPQLQGKQMVQSDLISYRGMASEIQEWKEKTGHAPLWTNAMFSGMPSYQITTVNAGNVNKYVEKGFQFYISRPIGYFLACSISTYILLIVLGVNPWLALIGAIGYTYTASILTLYEAGHSSKMRVLSFLPMLTAGLILVYRKKYPLGFALFAIGAGVGLLANHPQMLYYMSFPLFFYVVMKAIEAVQKKKLIDFGKASGGLMVTLLIALGCSATVLMTTMEYVEDTMRGDPILEHDKNMQGTSSTEKGLDWDYAMQWSQNMTDVMSLIAPGAAGGGSNEDGSWSKDLKNDRIWSQILRTNGNKVPMYHGGMPFTSGPAYIGIFFLFFFILGYFVKGGKFYHWILISAIFTILLSMGKNAAWLNRFMFDYVPLFNKFRTPNSILPITTLLFVLGGVVGLNDFLKASGKIALSDKQKAKQSTEKMPKRDPQKNLFISAGITAGLCVLAWIVAGASGFSSPGDQNIVQQGINIEPLVNARKALLQKDVLRNILLVLLGTGVLWAYLKNKIKTEIVLAILGVLVLFDVWSVGKRYINADSFQDDRVVSSYEQPREVDREIMADKDPHFRVFDMSINTFNSSTSSHFYKTIGGYHAAKLQRYQDLIDYHISKGNEQVLYMLNTKYVIDAQQGLHKMQSYGNAWFVEDVNFVSSNRDEIEKLNDADLRNTAVVHEEFKGVLKYNSYTAGGNENIQLTEYNPEKLTYSSNNSGDGFVVFSEIWYGPDKGWRAYIDGNEVPLVRVNYALRGIEVPQGSHEIVLEFHPTTYYSGLTISYISSILLILGIAGGLYLNFRKEKESA